MMANQRRLAVKRGMNMKRMMLQWRILRPHIGSTSNKWVIHTSIIIVMVSLRYWLQELRCLNGLDQAHWTMRLLKLTVLGNINLLLLLILPVVVKAQLLTDFLCDHILAPMTRTFKIGITARNVQLQVIMIILKMMIDDLVSMRTNLSSLMWVIPIWLGYNFTITILLE